MRLRGLGPGGATWAMVLTGLEMELRGRSVFRGLKGAIMLCGGTDHSPA